MFGRKNDRNEAAPAADPAQAAEPTQEPVSRDPRAKTGPTPTRKEREAARRRPLVASKDKEAKARYKEIERAEREKARVGLMNGDERYLTARDRGPQRRYVRDFVDARFSIGELFIPVALVMLIFGMFAGNTEFQLIVNVVVYGLLALVVLDSVILRFTLRGRLAAKFGGTDRIERGLTFYAIMRAIQMRPLRVPKPQVKRRQYPS